ncbi:MAG: KH domain-containing protein [Clostridiales bacterium]|nr:KH domain-containing protein [Clostridiales bacterium]
MKELLLYMAKSLVDNPDSVRVDEIEGDGDTTVLELRVAPEDMGKLIGRQGRIAREIRTIIKSVAQRTGKKVTVEIVD